MSTAPHDPPAESPAGDAPADEFLDRLDRLLGEQLSQAVSGDLDALAAVTGRIDGLLAGAARSLGKPTAPQAHRLARVLRLHHQTGLVLAEKKDDLSRRLAHSRRGRGALQAYRQGAT